MNTKKFLAAVSALLLAGSAIPVNTVAFAESDTALSDSEEEYTGIYFTAEDHGTYFKITGYEGSADAVAIPEEVYGVPVTSIGKLNADGPIGTLVLPSTVTEIEDGAFDDITGLAAIDIDGESENYTSENGVLYNKDMSELILYPYAKQDTSFVIPDTVTKIAPNAISSVLALEELTVGAGITSVGTDTFSSCPNLRSLVISASVESIDVEAVKKNSSVESFTVSEENTAYSSADGILFNKDASALICFPPNKSGASYAIPETVVTIAENAFAETDLLAVTVPDSVETIGKNAFSSMKSLTTVVLGNGVKEIGENVFANDTSLISIILNSAEVISDNAFDGCSSLRTITIPANTAVIASGAFDKCENLSDISVSDRNEVYSSIGGVLLNKNADTLIKYPLGKTASSYALPDSVKVIADNAFYNCTSLTDITFGASFAELTGTPFSGSTSILNYNVSEENESLSSVDGVILSKDGSMIVKYPFGRADGEYNVPDTVSAFAPDAFSDNSNITGFIVSENNAALTSVDGVVFSKDGSELIKYPSAAERNYYEISQAVCSVADNAFNNVTKLEGVAFLGNETAISSEAFSNMSNFFVIYGTTGSSAEIFAQEYGFDFVSTDGVYAFGDVSGDGKIDAIDASDVLTYYAAVATGHRGKFIPAQLTAADVQPDGTVNALDASRILTYYAYTATTTGDILSVADYFKVDDPTTPEDETENNADSDYKEAYASLIDELSANEELTYDLIYFNDDEIPELVASTSGYSVSLYTYSNGTVHTLMDKWTYGAMGNTGYEYSPKNNSLRNYNHDYAGLIGYTTYMTMSENCTLDTVVTIETHNFEDANGNGIPDEDEAASNGSYSVSYIDGVEVTEEQCNSYNVGEYEVICGSMSLDEIKAELSK
ncbi:MAG: leucine-rich repeat protein [Ruminococcus sp.]|nr:leucine-rich repeat protein [Ruminococcus sp.]